MMVTGEDMLPNAFFAEIFKIYLKPEKKTSTGKNEMQPNESQINEKGFTLIEIMIAICVFTIGVLAIASLQVVSLKGNADSMKLTEATMWATNQAEFFMGQDYDSADLAVGEHGPVVMENPIYNVSWTVSDALPNAKEVTLLVNWTSGSRTRSQTFNFVKAQL